MYDSAISSINKLEKKYTKNKKIKILLLTHAMYEHGIWTKSQRDGLVKKIITELSKHKEEFLTTVKIHPSSELISDYESIIYPIDKSIQIFQKGDILKYIINSDIIITYSGSSSLVYAFMCKKPIIVCNFYDLQNDIFIDRNVVAECKNENEIIKTIQKLKNSNSINEESIKKFTDEFFYKLDGKASERISHEIMNIVNNTRKKI